MGHTVVGRLVLGHTVRGKGRVGSTGHYEDSIRGTRQPLYWVRLHPDLRSLLVGVRRFGGRRNVSGSALSRRC